MQATREELAKLTAEVGAMRVKGSSSGGASDAVVEALQSQVMQWWADQKQVMQMNLTLTVYGHHVTSHDLLYHQQNRDTKVCLDEMGADVDTIRYSSPHNSSASTCMQSSNPYDFFAGP